MAKPQSRGQLINFGLRKLGYPVLEINLDTDQIHDALDDTIQMYNCLLYTSPSPRDLSTSRMPSSA